MDSFFFEWHCGQTQQIHELSEVSLQTGSPEQTIENGDHYSALQRVLRRQALFSHHTSRRGRRLLLMLRRKHQAYVPQGHQVRILLSGSLGQGRLTTTQLRKVPAQWLCQCMERQGERVSHHARRSDRMPAYNSASASEHKHQHRARSITDMRPLLRTQGGVCRSDVRLPRLQWTDLRYMRREHHRE